MTAAEKKPVGRLKKFGMDMWRTRWLHVMALPGLIYLAIFQYGPMYGVLMAFQNFRAVDGIWGSQWIGFEQFRRFFNHPFFAQLIANTLIINVYQLVFFFPLPIIFALLLNEVRGSLFKRSVQTVSYLPNFISTVAIVGMLIMFLSPTDGFINRIVFFFTGDTIHFMARPEWFRALYIFVDIWSGLGWGAIIYIAALAGVNPELYESAVLDGAGRIKMMRHISIPSIAPTIIILLLLRLGQMMSLGHEQVLLMQNPLNMQYSEVISTFVFRRGLEFNDFSFAQAVSVFNSGINIVILVCANAISRKVSETSLW